MESSGDRSPRRRGRRPMEWVFLGLLVLTLALSVTVAPLWRLLWRYPVYGALNFTKVEDRAGRSREGWRWVAGREIRVYQLPHLKGEYATDVAEGARDLLRDAGLDFEVKALPTPPAVLEAYRQSLGQEGGRAAGKVSFGKLQARLVELREGDPHADILIVDAPMEGASWAFGMGSFRGGLVLIQQSISSRDLGKHEVGHLMGYQMHDTFPAFVFGYPREGWPWSRDTLMLLASTNNTLSPRARDALRAFWGGMEQRLGMPFLLDEPPAAGGTGE